MRLGYLIILVLFANLLFAQSSFQTLNQYTTKEGLSNNMIYCMANDSRGFLWLGTKEGLNRFDGFQFKKYFTEKNNPASLPHDNILDLLEYRSGQLLIATGNGLAVLNTLTGQFENEKIKFPSIRPGSGTVIISIYKDQQSNIWVNHDGELDVLDSNLVYKYRFTDLDWAKDLKGVIVKLEHWYTDRQGRLWLPSDTSGIHIIDFAAKKIYNSKNNPQHLPFLKSQSIRSFFMDEENNMLWYSPWGEGLIAYNFLTGISHQQLFGLSRKDEERLINTMIKIAPDKLLCYINGNGYEINTTTFQCNLISEKSSLNDRTVQVITSLGIHTPGNDQYMIGSSQGLYQLGKEKTPYAELSLTTPGINSEMGDCTDVIISRSGRLYCTYMKNRLVIVEKNRKGFAHYSIPGQKEYAVTEVCEDKSGRIWIGTNRGIYLFDTIKKIFIQPGLLPAELLESSVNLIYCDNDGDVWINTRYPFGLYHYDPRNNKLLKLNNDITHHFEKLGQNSRISSIIEDREGNLWMSSRLGGGIINYEKKRDQWKMYPPAGRNFSLLSNALDALYPGDNNFLWLGSHFGDGLIRYDYKNDSIERFTRYDGLPSNYVLNIVGDTSGLWLMTETGITNFDPVSHKVKHTIAKTSSEEEQLVKDSTNSILIATQDDHLLFISTNTIKSNESFPHPVIDKIIVNNKIQFIDPGNYQLSLDHDQKNISIDFTAIGLFNSREVRFAYKLTGVDNDWIYPTSNRTAQYSILGPGNYTFKLKVSNETGAWSPEEATFSFSIATAWWQTTLFRMAVVLLIAGIISIMFLKRVQIIRHESEMKQRIAETEMMALRAQMNPHFIFNCINSIDALIQSNDKYQATVYLNKFAKLIRNILDSSKQNVVTLSKDMETLQLYIDMEQFRNENKFTVNIKAEISLLQDDYKIPPLIVQPYVENAILHGLKNRLDNEGRLSVSVTRQNGQIEFIIEDNGVGRKLLNGYLRDGQQKQNDKRSYGMQMSQERVKIFNKEDTPSVFITDLETDGKAAGTKVQVLLNIQ